MRSRFRADGPFDKAGLCFRFFWCFRFAVGLVLVGLAAVQALQPVTVEAAAGLAPVPPPVSESASRSAPVRPPVSESASASGTAADVSEACEPGDSEGGAVRRVVIVDLETEVELWWAPACEGDEIWYTYTHSADKTPVQSLLRVEAPPVGLVLVLERYLWYGAGLEYRADRGVVLDGEWVVVEAERAVGRLPLRVAGTVEQEIVVGHWRTTLGELAEFGGRVMLEVRP